MTDQNTPTAPHNDAFAHLALAAESLSSALGLHIAIGALDQARPLVSALSSALDALLGVAAYRPPVADPPVSAPLALVPSPPAVPVTTVGDMLDAAGLPTVATPAPVEALSAPVAPAETKPAPTPTPAPVDPPAAVQAPASAMPGPEANPTASEGLDPGPSPQA